MTLQIRRIMLFVKDLEAMTDFYETKLGLTILDRSPGFVDFDAGNCRLALHSTPNPAAGKTKICFYAKDVSKTRAALLKRGVPLGKDPGIGPGLKLCDAKDPEGNIIQLSNRP